MRALRAERLTPVVCPQLLGELAAVLLRPKFRRYASLTQVSSYVTIIADRAEHWSDPEVVPARCRDPHDDYLLALAEQAAADMLVSEDADLLSLVSSPPIVSPRSFIDSHGAVF